ncbi:elongation factor G [Nocardioides cavernaquae]|uniref:Elongation factor G n=1 Tax=Nocardioides cavernaquae TaxID=2321396 RepID=A0A3A5HD38_9ACTN|nr:elongation factor G [Nocardioides cavernaquae]
MANGRPGNTVDVATPDLIRNVALVGPTGSGKSALVAALLGGHDPLAQERSVSLAVSPLLHDGTKVNLVDTPGYADFAGEVRAALRAVDAVLFVLPANGAIDEAARQLWRECSQTPRAIVVTKLDHARADYDGVLAAAQAAYGERVMPVLQRTDALIEAVIEESEDEGLMERYLAGEPVEETQLMADLERAMARGTFHPVVPACAATGEGLSDLLDLVVRGFPSPHEHPSPEVFTPAGGRAEALTCDPSGPLVAEVVKTTSDNYLGRVSIVRVFSGTLQPDHPVHVSGHFSAFFGDGSGHEDHDEDDRPTMLTPRLIAGDIGSLGKLGHAETGDTLSDPESPRLLRPWELPDPQLPIAIEADTQSDDDHLSGALARLAAEDPSLRIERNAETHQVVLWVLGEAHAEVALGRLRDRYGVSVSQVDLVIPLRSTFAGPAKGHGRHVKQSGGHGQFAICDLEVEPLPRGSGFEFVDRVVGGAVPRQYVASIEKGVVAQMARGISDGRPLVDLRVTLVDGKSHSVDSSDMAFQSAGALALREAAEATELIDLEPYDEVSVLIPDDVVGEVMSDLSARHGRLLGSEQVGAGGPGGRTLAKALVPHRSLVRYAIDLRAATHGVGTFTRTFASYEPVS